MDSTKMDPDKFSNCNFNFIIVGGGTAGLAVAARLSENPLITVGVLEAGPEAFGEEDIDIPGYFGRTLGGKYDWQFETTSQPALGGRTIMFNRGKVLGGSSALNFMTWNRGSKEDYDAWEDLGNTGWGWDGLLFVSS
jgi:choline dehydrogenase-like flavoprotein